MSSLPFGKRRASLLLNPARAICLSFLAVIAVGTLLLMLPFSSRTGQYTDFLDSLFTATSATCVTGLIVFDTATQWTPFGQGVIIALIQIGGLGLLTITTFFNIIIGKKLGFHSVQRAQEAISLSGGLDINAMIRIVIKATLMMEGIGAVLLCFYFVPEYGLHGLFISCFLSISAFCNAGFDILGFEQPFTSLTAFNDNPLVLLTIGGLIVLGGLGFVVWHDLMDYRKTRKLMLHSRVVLLMTGILIVLGTVMFLVCEWSNPDTLHNLPPAQRFLAAFFQSITTRTAGFNSIDIEAMRPLTKFFTVILMFIGAAPGSTGGGIKVTTIAVVIMTVVSVVTGREETVIMRRKVNKETVYKSLTVIVLAGLLVLLAAAVIYFTIPAADLQTGINAVFESISAFATVGLSAGVTGVANIPSKIVLLLCMFTGRVGPISFILSLAMHNSARSRTKVIPDGKIMVG